MSGTITGKTYSNLHVRTFWGGPYLWVIFIFFLFFSSWGVVGQGVTISSTESSPTSANPIPFNIKFEDGVDKLDFLDVFVSNGSILNILREEPDFSFKGTERRLEQFQVKTTTTELISAVFAGNIQEYLKAKIKKAVISIDFNKNNELFYLTLDDGIFKIDGIGNAVRVISGNQFESPLDMVINRENGNIHVADAEKGQVLIFNSTYTLIKTIGTGSNADSNNPRGATGLALDNDGNIYVADNFTGNTPGQDAIKIYSPNGNLIKKISTYDGQQIEDPYRIAVDKFKNIYVSESGGEEREARIIIFDNDYYPVKIIQGGVQGNPGSLVVDDYGYLYAINYEDDFNLTDLFNNPLQVLENYETIRDGKYTVNVFDTNQDYSFVKEFNNSELNLPIDIALDNCGLIYLINLKLQGNKPQDFYGYPALMDINFDFTLKKFQRQDNFLLYITPENPGEVKVSIENKDLFKCAPQPSGQFSIFYQPENTNNQPTANNDTYTTEQDVTLNVLVADGVLKNDTDADNDPLKAIVVATTTNGTLTLNSDGSFSYVPNPGFVGTDTFVYVANDGTVDSNNATVTITVTLVPPVNTAPVAVNDSYTTPQNTTLNIPAAGVLSNDTDAENNSLTARLITNVTNGTLTLNPNGSFSYVPNPGFVGTDTFVYVANDGT
ncbi:MAG TPA: Ig-like domain-containing protein, partial [Gillisia sp.]|nr:Ig-like domain-containing protein [Gillisia sp.]